MYNPIHTTFRGGFVHSIAVIVRPGFQFMSVAALSTFEFANYAAGRTLYDIKIYSEQGGLVPSSLHAGIDTLPWRGADFETLLVTGTVNNGPAPKTLTDYLRDASARACRIGAIGLGAFALAEAGLLDGRRVTVHWQSSSKMRSLFPAVQVDENKIYVIDGNIWTSAGMSATLDLTLGMVERDHGRALALDVAQRLVLYHRRAGGQSQHSALLELYPASDRIQQVLEYARNNLRRNLSVEELADVAALSPRQFSRAFRAETGVSPAKAIENLRIEAARLLLEQSRISVDAVAVETGFGDRRRMSRAFVRSTGRPPQVVRRLAGVTGG